MKIENNDSKKIVVNTELAQALLEVRTRKGLTQKDLEDKTKKLIGVEPCSYQDISRIETQRFKRIEVAKIKTIEKALELKNIRAVHGRAEEFGIKPDYRQQFDIATARAVARMPVLLEICLPFVKKGGIFIALKGPELENEIKESSNALKELGGKVVDVQQFTLADGAYTRNLAVIEKIKDTPKKYPRKAGTPQKKPL